MVQRLTLLVRVFSLRSLSLPPCLDQLGISTYLSLVSDLQRNLRAVLTRDMELLGKLDFPMAHEEHSSVVERAFDDPEFRKAPHALHFACEMMKDIDIGRRSNASVSDTYNLLSSAADVSVKKKYSGTPLSAP